MYSNDTTSASRGSLDITLHTFITLLSAEFGVVFLFLLMREHVVETLYPAHSLQGDKSLFQEVPGKAPDIVNHVY